MPDTHLEHFLWIVANRLQLLVVILVPAEAVFAAEEFREPLRSLPIGLFFLEFRA